MKYRIIELRDGDGKPFFKIQHKWLWRWRNYGIDEIDVFNGYTLIESKSFNFKTYREAKDALIRSQKEHSHKGIKIYPTINPSLFYVLKWGRRSYVRELGYDYLINGSYGHCWAAIDHHIKADQYKKYKKAINVNIDQL